MPTSNTAESSVSQRNAFERPPTAQDLTEALHYAADLNAAHNDRVDVSSGRNAARNRRATRRYKLRLPVIFNAGGRVGFGSSVDVSLGGMFIETDTPRLFGERITVKFRAAGIKKPLSAPAVVRWVEPGRGMGVAFESVRPVVIWALQKELGER